MKLNMNILDNLGISYKAGYLIQGNQIERCNISKKLKVKNTELMIRNDGKDYNISKKLKNYKDNIIFHLPAINPDLSNLNTVNNVVKELKQNNIKLVTIDASNLSNDLFEWSTIEEQKEYFLNIVTAIATLASNKIEVAIQNLKASEDDNKFGSKISQLTDVLIYSRKLLVKDFGITEEDSNKYIGISLNIDNMDIQIEKDNINNYLEVFNDSIKCIKICDTSLLNYVLDFLKDKSIPLLMQTKSDLEEVKGEYDEFKKNIIDYLNINEIQVVESKNEDNNIKDNKEFSNIIIYTMVVLTIVIIALMFYIKLR